MNLLRLRLLAGLSVALGLASAPARAQRSLVQQFAGSTVLLTSGDTLTGPLTLHADRDLLLVSMPDETVRTVSAQGVAAFAVKGELSQPAEYYDQYYDFYQARRGYFHGNPMVGLPTPQARRQRPDVERVRVFRTFRWNHGNDYSDFRTPAFFEQLSRGPVLLLRREQLVERTVTAADPFLRSYYGYPTGAMPRGPVGYYTTIRDQFYLGTPQGTVVQLRNPRKDLLAYFKREADAIERYARENKLNFTDARELAYIVNYANSLRREEAEEPRP